VTDQFAGWRSLLAGEPVQFDANEPLAGYYRTRRKGGEWQPVGIWKSDELTEMLDGEWAVMLSGYPVTVDRVWPWCAKYPISYETYVAVAERGEPWPDQHEAVTNLHNRPPPDDSIESIRDTIEDLAREAQQLIAKGAAKTQEESDRAADLSNEIAKYRKKADEVREAEKKPHLEAGRAVDERWRAVIAAADIYKQLKDAVCAPFLAAQKLAKQKAEAAAREAAQQAAKAGKIEEAAAAQLKADNIAKTRTTSGSRGRAVHLHSVQVVSIVDRAAVLAFFAESEAITNVLQSLAEKATGAGIKVPGTKVEMEERAR